MEFIGAADLYITPYLNPAQITSGTLAYAFGCGKAVISTPYWHAEELLCGRARHLVPFADSDGNGRRQILGLLADEHSPPRMRKKAYMLGREMIWRQVADRYLEAFQAPASVRVVVAAGTSARSANSPASCRSCGSTTCCG